MTASRGCGIGAFLLGVFPSKVAIAKALQRVVNITVAIMVLSWSQAGAKHHSRDSVTPVELVVDGIENSSKVNDPQSLRVSRS